MKSDTLPDRFDDLDQLEDALSQPSDALVKTLDGVDGDLLVLGVGGKMGPTLARMAKRAHPDRRVIGVARFSEAGLRDKLQAHGIECIEADLLSREQIAKLPDAANIVFMAGRKFGSYGSEWLTWAMNAHVPALVAERWKDSRIVCFSTACVYPFVNVQGPGASEQTAPTAPSGEYANSCVARERMFEHFSHQHGTPGRLLRLSYAIDMRYGVLHDLAQKIIHHVPIELAMGHANIIWQGEANDWALRSLAQDGVRELDATVMKDGLVRADESSRSSAAHLLIPHGWSTAAARSSCSGHSRSAWTACSTGLPTGRNAA